MSFSRCVARRRLVSRLAGGLQAQLAVEHRDGDAADARALDAPRRSPDLQLDATRLAHGVALLGAGAYAAAAIGQPQHALLDQIGAERAVGCSGHRILADSHRGWKEAAVRDAAGFEDLTGECHEADQTNGLARFGQLAGTRRQRPELVATRDGHEQLDAAAPNRQLAIEHAGIATQELHDRASFEWA